MYMKNAAHDPGNVNYKLCRPNAAPIAVPMAGPACDAALTGSADADSHQRVALQAQSFLLHSGLPAAGAGAGAGTTHVSSRQRQHQQQVEDATAEPTAHLSCIILIQAPLFLSCCRHTEGRSSDWNRTAADWCDLVTPGVQTRRGCC